MDLLSASNGAHQTNTSRHRGSVTAYQIDCQTTKKGRMIAGTKRRICWRFGFSNADALNEGLSGTDCRGEEHEVVFVWSLTSGKKFVLADGDEVHWSKESTFCRPFDGNWEWEWEAFMAGSKRKMKVVAHSPSAFFEKKKSPKNANTSVSDSSFRNFDFIIDGVSFSDMLKVFELGGKKQNNRETDYGLRHSIQPSQTYGQTRAVAAFSSQPLLVELGRQHQQYPSPTGSHLIFPFQSAPDMNVNLSSSPTSVLGGGGHSCQYSHFRYGFHQNHQHQATQSYPCQVSPTSVANPFDIYTVGTSLKMNQCTGHEQIQTQAQNRNFSQYPQERNQSKEQYLR